MREHYIKTIRKKSSSGGHIGTLGRLMKTVLAGLILILGLGMNSEAQVTVTIGSGSSTTSSYFPNYYLYNYSYAQAIYTAAEINSGGWANGGSAVITKIRFKPTAGVSTSNWQSWVVYMGNTTQGSFSSNTNWIATSNMTQVFNGNLPNNVTANQWVELTLSTPFTWDGVSNLVIAVDENTPGYGNSPSWAGYNSGTNKVIYYYNDNTNPNPASPPSANNRTGTSAQIQMDLNSTVPCTGTPNPGNTVSTLVNACPNAPFTLSFQNNVSGPGITYQWESADNATFTTGVDTLGTSSSLTTTQTTGKYYRCLVSCGNSSSSVYSNPLFVDINPVSECYCTPSTSGGATYYINNFTASGPSGTLNKTSGSNAQGYADFHLTDTMTVLQGDVVNYTMSVAGGSSYGRAIWIDYNQDGIFQANERVASSSSYSVSPLTGSFTIPLTTPAGFTRMRIVASYTPADPSDPCTNSGNGEYQDYTVHVIALTPCSGTPSAGTINSSTPFGICQGTPLDLSVGGTTIGTGISYQWQQRNPSGTGNWTNIAGATNIALSIPAGISTATDYRFIIFCSNGNSSDTTAPVTATINPANTCFCTPATSGGTTYYISNFTTTGAIANINKTSGSSSSGYSDFHNTDVMSVLAGSATPINYSVTVAGGSNYGLGIWIDLNQDGVFQSSEEVFLSSTYANSPITGTFTIPATATPGLTRMRIIASYTPGNPSNPCTNTGSGEYEDYGVMIIPAIPCTGVPNADTVTATPDLVYHGQSYSLSAGPNLTVGLGLTYQWQSSPAGQNTWTNVAGATNPGLNATMANSSLDYRLIVTCTNSNSSDTSNVATVTLKQPDYQPAALNGFNYDVIANGVGAASASTNNDVDGVSYALVAQDFQASTTGPLPVKYLPSDRIIQQNEKQFLLNDYSQNNSLRLTSGQSGNLVFVNPKRAQKVYVLGVSGSGVSTVNATIHFDDGTTQAANSLSWPDWFATTGDIIASEVGRVLITSNALEAGAGPQLFGNLININTANQHKFIDSITFSVQSNSHVMNVLAISFMASDTCADVSGVNVTNVGSQSATASWTALVPVPGNGYDYYLSSSSTTPSSSATPTGNTNNNSVGLTGLSPNTAYYFWVRSSCSATNSGNWVSQPATFTTICDTPVLSMVDTLTHCSGSTVTLDAGSGWSSYSWTPGNDTTQTISVSPATSTYYHATVTNQYGCTATDSTYVEATPAPVINLGNDTALCPGASLTLDAQLTSGSYLWSTGDSTQTITVDTPGTYSVTVTNAQSGCVSQDAIVISAGVVPTANLNDTTVLCAGDTAILNAGNAGSTYLWSTGATTQNIHVGTSGSYSVVVTSVNGCTTADTTYLNDKPLPVIDLGNDTAVCKGTSIALNAGSGFSNYHWTPGNSTSQTLNLTINNSVTYSVKVTDQNGCQNTDTITVTSNPLPVVNLGNDTTICPSDQFTLDGTVANAVSYNWNTGATTATIPVSATGTYKLTVTDTNGCVGHDSIIVSAGTVPTNVLPESVDLCVGSTTLLDAGNGGSTYLWSTGSTAQSIQVNTPGTYTVTVTSGTLCAGIDTVQVISRPLPVIDLGGDKILCDGDQVVLDAQNSGSTYLWSTGETTQTIVVSDSGTYDVTVTSPYDCVNSGTVNVAIYPIVSVDGFNFIPYFHADEPGRVRFEPINPQNVTEYRWDFGDGSQSTDSTPDHTFTGTGDYLVTLTVSGVGACDSETVTQAIHVDLTTGIVEAQQPDYSVQLYPNPAREKVIIKAQTSNTVNMTKVSVFDVLGKRVYEAKVTQQNMVEIPVQGLASGIYSVRILLSNNQIVNKRFEVGH